MEKTKSLRALLVMQSFVPLEQDQEGQLRGGFAALSSKGLNNCSCDNVPNNCPCNGNNCGCPPMTPPNNCTCKETEETINNCDCYSTTKPPVTAAPSSESTASTTGVSMSGYWPGLM